MKRLSMLAAGFLIGAAGVQYSGAASGQSDGWITLLDSTGMGDWDEVGNANWAMKDGAVVADKLDGKDLGYLVSKNSYKDFQIRAEFWVSDDANSGIFIRCEQPKSIGGKTCIFDQRPDPSYGTGAIVNVAKPTKFLKAGGHWNTYLITAQGGRFTAVLNGVRTALALAFILLVSSELIVSQRGFGYLIGYLGSTGSYEGMYAVVLTVAFLGFAADRLYQLLTQRLLRWRD